MKKILILGIVAIISILSTSIAAGAGGEVKGFLTGDRFFTDSDDAHAWYDSDIGVVFWTDYWSDPGHPTTYVVGYVYGADRYGQNGQYLSLRMDEG